MQKIKFDFEATKERIYAPNSNVPIGAPVDINGNIANDGNAYGIVLCKETENEKYWVRYNLVVMVAGYCDIIDAQAIWGDEYSAEAIAAMSDIVFCDNHKIGVGGGGDVMIVNLTYDRETETYTADKTFNEISEKISSGGKVVVSDGLWFFEVNDYSDATIDFIKVVWGGAETDYAVFEVLTYSVNNDNSVVSTSNEYNLAIYNQ